MPRLGKLPRLARAEHSWMGPLMTGATVAILAADPAPLVPLATGYRNLCDRFPALALVTNHLPPLPMALLSSLVAVALLMGGTVGLTQLIRAHYLNRRLDERAHPAPARLVRAGERLGLGTRLIYLNDPAPAAFCYGFVRPCVAVTAGLLKRLDDEELTAALAHERYHVQRRDPARYLALHALAATGFMFPIAAALRRRLETRIELAADRAALTVASRGALAGALLCVLSNGNMRRAGTVGLTATEARIACLAGTSALPPIHVRSTAVSLGVVLVILAAVVDLAMAADLIQMACPLCPWA